MCLIFILFRNFKKHIFHNNKILKTYTQIYRSENKNYISFILLNHIKYFIQWRTSTTHHFSIISNVKATGLCFSSIS